MHSTREGIPIIFQAGPAYGRQVEWGDTDGALWAFPAGFDSTRCSQGCPTMARLLTGATCSRAGGGRSMRTMRKSSRQAKPITWLRATCP